MLGLPDPREQSSLPLLKTGLERAQWSPGPAPDNIEDFGWDAGVIEPVYEGGQDCAVDSSLPDLLWFLPPG